MTDPPAFTPVSSRARHDGWTPERQARFIEALAESACVEEACRVVGMSVNSAYVLRRRGDAFPFRKAWEVALDHGLGRLSDALVSRAIHGVSVPHFYKGEQVGEHRRYDNRLAMWLLRVRDPVNYGRGRDALVERENPDGVAVALESFVDGIRGRPCRIAERNYNSGLGDDAFRSRAEDAPR